MFNIFKKQENPVMEISLPVSENNQQAADEVRSIESPNSSNVKKPLTVSYATGWPIDVIYGYLHKNYEQKGFEDAMIKSDLTFRDMNINIIKNKILMVFREINLNYDVLRNELESRLENCRAAGLLTTISEIETNLNIIDTHKNELNQLESSFRNNDNEVSIPLQSYECGFLRGISTIALSATHRVNSPLSFSNIKSTTDGKVTA